MSFRGEFGGEDEKNISTASECLLLLLSAESHDIFAALEQTSTKVQSFLTHKYFNKRYERPVLNRALISMGVQDCHLLNVHDFELVNITIPPTKGKLIIFFLSSILFLKSRCRIISMFCFFDPSIEFIPVRNVTNFAFYKFANVALLGTCEGGTLKCTPKKELTIVVKMLYSRKIQRLGPKNYTVREQYFLLFLEPT